MDAKDMNSNVMHEYQPERSSGATDKGPRRAENQDAFWIPDQDTPLDLGALYLVADGVGGQQDGAVAALLAVETVRQEFYELRRQGKPIPDALKEALERANRKIIDEAQKREVRKMGATFVAAVQDTNKLIVAHVGDARAYLVRQGELRQLTRDDTWVQRQVDAGLISEEEAIKHEFRNVVTQVLGNKAEITVNLSQSHELLADDAILLCSDGLYDIVPDKRLKSLTSENDPQSAARMLVEAAIDAEATDNITAVVFRTSKLVPIADESTLAPIPTMVAAAPTISSPPISQPTQPQPKDKGGIPRWLIVLSIIAIFLIIAALALFWLQNRNVAEDSIEAAETALPAIVASPEATSTQKALRAIESTSTAELLLVTDEPLASATIRPLDTPTPRSTPVPTLQAVSESRGCANGEVFPYIRTDAQFNAGCTTAFMVLEVGDEVRILSDQSVSPGGGCGTSQYIKIQSITDEALEGWVDESAIDLISASESCGP
jgi:protein phosphatase